MVQKRIVMLGGSAFAEKMSMECGAVEVDGALVSSSQGTATVFIQKIFGKLIRIPCGVLVARGAQEQAFRIFGLVLMERSKGSGSRVKLGH
jgi:hypothetical protein